MTITNVTTGSGATVSVFAVLSSIAPALRSAASLRVPAAEHTVRPSPAPPPLPRLILGLPPGLVRTVAVLVRSGRGVACVFNTNRCGLRFYIKNTISPTISLIIRLIVALIVIYGSRKGD